MTFCILLTIVAEEHVTVTHVVLLDNLLEARIVELCKLGQIVHISNDIAQVLFEQLKIVFCRRFIARRKRRVIDLAHNLVDLLLRRGDSTNNLLSFNLLESINLVQLALELLYEALFRLMVPDAGSAQRRFELLVVDVVENPIAIQRLSQLLTEST